MEEKVLELVASDRIDIPLSSMEQKLRRTKNKIAKNLAEELGTSRYEDQRVFAFVKTEDKERARGMKEAVAEFAEEFPKYGSILLGKIAEKRVLAEDHLYFGVNHNCKLTSEDYMGVMRSLGLSDTTAKNLYPDLMEVSRKLKRKRDEERSILVGKYSADE
ncbi:MAG: hypothetical protein AABW65_01080 [Nanoarchaeota archaeon]